MNINKFIHTAAIVIITIGTWEMLDCFMDNFNVHNFLFYLVVAFSGVIALFVKIDK